MADVTNGIEYYRPQIQLYYCFSFHQLSDIFKPTTCKRLFGTTCKLNIPTISNQLSVMYYNSSDWFLHQAMISNQLTVSTCYIDKFFGWDACLIWVSHSWK